MLIPRVRGRNTGRCGDTERAATRDSRTRTAGRGGYDGVRDDYILDKAILAWC